MRGFSSDESFRVLQLPRSAGPAEVRMAFRRLAKQHHPDLNRSPESGRRFARVVKAYRVLQHELGLLGDGSARRRCPRCGNYDELLDGLDGRPGCADCLLGLTRLSRFLPPYAVETVKHVAVLVLYVLGVALAVNYATTHDLDYALLSLGAIATGMLTLAGTCLTVRRVR